jgi:hypothetical protein
MGTRAGWGLLLPLAAALWVLAGSSSSWAEKPRQVWLGEPRREGRATVVPLAIDDLGQVVSIDLELVFDARAAQGIQVRPTALLSGFLLAYNVVGDTLRVAAAGFTAGQGSGTILEIAVEAIEPPRFGLILVSLNGDQLPVDFERPTPPVATAVVRTEPPLGAGGCALAPSIPNPFNARATVRWRLAQDGEARVEVLDPLGRVVRILAAGQQTAGPHQATWDGRDADGRPVASGVYLCRLVASRLVLTRRLVLVR